MRRLGRADLHLGDSAVTGTEGVVEPPAWSVAVTTKLACAGQASPVNNTRLGGSALICPTGVSLFGQHTFIQRLMPLQKAYPSRSRGSANLLTSYNFRASYKTLSIVPRPPYHTGWASITPGERA